MNHAVVSAGPLRPAPLVAAAVALLVFAGSAAAQTANANHVAFHPSPHHAATLSTGEPVVRHYELTFYRVGTSETVASVDLGKPSPQADGVIRVDYTAKLGVWPLPDVPCEARVAAVGSGGSTFSAPSDPFAYTCSYRLSAAGDSFAASGGTGLVEVSSGTLCGWSASSPVAWLAISSGASGAAAGWVSYSVAPNSGEPRSTTLTIAGLSYMVSQQGTSSSSNVPPTVRITQPATGSQIRTPPPLKITAEAADSDDQVAKVEFYANGAHIATSTSAPYHVRWKLPSAGVFTLTAVAEDTRGARTTSAPVSVTAR